MWEGITVDYFYVARILNCEYHTALAKNFNCGKK